MNTHQPWPVLDSHSQIPSVLRRVQTSRSRRVLARVLVVGLTLLAVGLVWIPWQQSSVGWGRVVAFAPLERRQPIEAPLEGRIVRWWVREGSRVRQGDPLVELGDNDPELLMRLQAERDAVEARLEAARARAAAISERESSLRQSRSSALDAAGARARMATDRIRSAERALDAADATHRTALLQIERQGRLAAQGLSSRRQLELAEMDEAKARAEVDRARAALGAAQSELLALEADREKAGTDLGASVQDARAAHASALAEASSASAELARLDVRLARQQSQWVTAPRDGTVLRLIAGQGNDLVKTGDTLAILVPEAQEHAVEMWVDGNDVPLVSEGRGVRLQFEGWPALQFSGWPSVAVGTFAGRVAFVDSADDGNGKFRVMVVPVEGQAWPDPRYLRQGVRAHGWILLDTVPLGYELWRLFNGFPPSVQPPSSEAGEKPGGAKGGK